MALVAGTIITDVKGLLNDPTGSIYPDQALIPFLNKAYRELQSKMNALGISTSKEVNGAIVVLAGIKSLGDGGGLPNDLIIPIELAEREAGTTAQFSPMTETEWERDEKPIQTLRYWNWREETLYLVGATTDRQVMIRYMKELIPITDINSPVLINGSQVWLGQRTAAIAALLLGQNASRAKDLMDDLYKPEGPWEDFKAVKVKRMQNIPVRRRRTRWRVA